MIKRVITARELSMDDPKHLSAFVKLLTNHQGEIRAFVISLLPGSPDVADVVQETNLVLWNKRDNFELGTNFVAWAFTTARYQVMKQRLRQKRDGKVMFSDELIDTLAEMAPPPGTNDEYLLALEECMERLNPAQRKMISSRYSAGMSLQKQAAASGGTAGSLRIALMRLRAGLRLCVERQIKGGVA